MNAQDVRSNETDERFASHRRRHRVRKIPEDRYANHLQMPELVLTPLQRRSLKARAHGLRPVVLLGAAGLTEMVLREIDRALVAHQLVKIKVPLNDRGERAQVATDVAEKLSAAKVQSIGKMIVLFRPCAETEEKQEAAGAVRQRQMNGRARRKEGA